VARRNCLYVTEIISGLNHVSHGELFPQDDWFAIGMAMRATTVLAMQMDTEGMAVRGLTKWNFESEFRKNIESYVDSVYPRSPQSNFGSSIIRESAKACALGNPAACIGF